MSRATSIGSDKPRSARPMIRTAVLFVAGSFLAFYAVCGTHLYVVLLPGVFFILASIAYAVLSRIHPK